MTVKVTELGAEVPAAPVQVNEYVSVPVSVGVSVWVPVVASVPLHAPEAVQLVALVEDQVILVELPRSIEVGVRVRVGAVGGAVTVKVSVLVAEEPSALAQVSE